MNLFGANPALSRPESINDVRNGILLRADLHFALDMHKFTFCVKNGRVVVHFLQPTADLGRQFYNVELRAVQDAAPEFFFARFALSVFPLVRNFAGAPGRRILRGREITEVVEQPLKPAAKKRRFQAVHELRPPRERVDVASNSSMSSAVVTSDAEVNTDSDDQLNVANVPDVPWHERVLAEPHDTDDEDREDKELAATFFPGVFDEEKVAGAQMSEAYARHTFEDINFYPRLRKMRRLKAHWMKDHPNVWTVHEERSES